MLEKYLQHQQQRQSDNLPTQPLSAEWTQELVQALREENSGLEYNFLLDLLENRIPPGVDEAAYVKAAFLSAIAKNEEKSPISREKSIELLGKMHGGYSVATLIELLTDAAVAELAAKELKYTLLIFETFHDVAQLADEGNSHAQNVLQSWAKAEWFTARKKIPKSIKAICFKIEGETNTDDLSPAPEAWSRPDIPLHAQSMYKNPREGLEKPLEILTALKKKNLPIAFIGDVLGTGSSRKSATNSILWHTGEDLPGIPNKKGGGICIGGQVSPIFYNTMEDAGALVLETNVDKIHMGDEMEIQPYENKILNAQGKLITEFTLPETLLDSVQAGGRINLIIGRALTDKARAHLKLGPQHIFRKPRDTSAVTGGYTLAQKIVGRACGTKGIRPHTYCEPTITTVGSQDTTGPMTRDELKDLACLGFSADLVMQSFCHTAAYPKPIDIQTQHSLPDFIINRGGVSLRPGDGIIHSWLNRMLLPDTVGTGGDSHTRFPIGISFPAGSGLVAFSAATGTMPLDMPESVLVKFSGEIQPGITLRDLVHAIPYFAKQQNLLTISKKNKVNVFSGRILEIEGLENLTVEQAFELSDASAERSAAGCTINLSEKTITEYLRSNIVLLRWMIDEGYNDARTLERRAGKMEEWIAAPELMRADQDASYHTTIKIDLNAIKEPVLCAPNDPDDARSLSEVAGDSIDEVFIGSCMTNIGHYRAAGKLLEAHGNIKTSRLWIAPPTKMDEYALMQEGYYSIYAQSGARTEKPGCSLCMGNQARVADNATVLSTSTRNFPNRLGNGANVYLCSAELAAIGSLLGKIPTLQEYTQYIATINTQSQEIYKYLNFDTIKSFQEGAENGRRISAEQLVEVQTLG